MYVRKPMREARKFAPGRNALVCPGPTAPMDATVEVVEIEDVGANTVAVKFSTPEGFEAEPGQFVRLEATIDGEEYGRFYTLSSPTVSDTFEVTVGIDPEESGPFSEFLVSLEPGVTLEMTGPYGDQYYDGEPRAVVLAGGPGVGPAVAIAERALAAGNEAAVVYRYEGSPAHGPRLGRLRERGATVRVTDAPIDVPVAEVVTGDPGEQLFVYGFASFLEIAERAVESAGGDLEGAKVENFG